MTISSQTSKAAFSGNGVSTAFPLPFPYLREADIKALLRHDGFETPLAPGTHYTLSGAGSAQGGALVMNQPPATGQTLVVYRAPAIVQEVDYVENSAFPAETHEAALDLLTMICQSLQEQLGRAVLYPVSTPADDVLGSQAFLAATTQSRDAARSAEQNAAASAGQASLSASQAAASAASAEAVANTADGLVKVSLGDAAARSLSSKLLAGNGLAEGIENPGGDEALRLAVALAEDSGLEFAGGLLRVECGSGLALAASGLVADVGTGPGQLVQLDANGRLPALDARNLTNSVSADQQARDNAAMNAFLAQLSGGRASGPVPGGGLYTFKSDELTSSGASYDATWDYYGSQVSIGTNFLPIFTTSAVNGYTLSASGEVPGYPAYYAAGNGSQAWLTGSPSGVNWLKIAFPSAQFISSYDMRAGSSWAPKNWQLEGSSTGAFAGEQVVLDTRADITSWVAATQTLSFTCSNPGLYQYMRLVITANNGHGSHGGGLQGLSVRGAGAVSDMTLTSGPVSFGTPPNKATVYLLHKALDAATMNIDLKVRVARGGSWAEAADLTVLNIYDTNYKLLRATVKLDGLPAGSAAYWRVQTYNNKSQRVRAALLWAE